MFYRFRFTNKIIRNKQKIQFYSQNVPHMMQLVVHSGCVMFKVEPCTCRLKDKIINLKPSYSKSKPS